MSQVTTTLPRAIELHRAGDLAEAETLYRTVLSETPGHPAALNLLGVACSQQGRHAEAERFLRDAARARPRDAAIRYNLGNVLRERGDRRGALAEFEATIAIDPGHGSAHFNLGATQQELGRPDLAAAAFARAHDADPDHPRALERLLNVALERHLAGGHEDAVAMLEDFTTRAPDLAPGWCNLGIALRELGRHADARAALERSAALDPALETAGINLALAHLDVIDPTSALRVCRRLLEHRPDSVLGNRTMARILIAIGEADMACEHLRHAACFAPADAAIAIELADAHRSGGRLDAADVALERAIDLDASNAALWKGRVDIALLRGDRPAAAARADAMRRAFPDAPAALAAAAAVAAHDGDHAEAAALLERALAGPVPDPTLERSMQLALGRARDALGAYDRAWEAFTRAHGAARPPLDRTALAARVDAIIEAFPAGPPVTPARVAVPDGHARPVFIAGMPRSGSTLVEQILDAHPDIAGGGEATLLGRIENRLPEDAPPFPRGVRSLPPAALEALASFGRTELARLARGHGVVVEKTLTNTFYVGLIGMLFPDARVVVCERDPVDACLSCLMQDFEGASPYTGSLDDLGFARREHDRMVDHWRAAPPVPILTVGYEQLVADPERVTRELLAFCGVPWNPACLEFHRNERTVLTASSTQVRVPIYATSIGRWRHYEEHLGPLLRALRSPGADARSGGDQTSSSGSSTSSKYSASS